MQRHDTRAKGPTLDLSWPFCDLADERGRDVGWVGMHGPVRTAAEHDRLDALRGQVRLLGFTSFLTFPRWVEPAYPLDYATLCDAWCHCFRQPDRHLPAGAPRLLLPHSDFTDPSRVSPDRLLPGDDDGKDVDFVYVCQDGEWQEYVRNWPLARECLPVLCGDLGLRGLLVGRPAVAGVPDGCEVVGRLPWSELMTRIRRARFLFVPNGVDPSPRVLAEAMAMDTPVLVNRAILGGWHYVNPFTGAFFDGAYDVAAAARRCLAPKGSPRTWYRAHYGPVRSGTRLARFLRTVDPRLDGVRRIDLVPSGSA